MITVNFKNVVIVLTIGLVMVSCGGRSSNAHQSVRIAKNCLDNLDFELERDGLPVYWYAGNGGILNGNFKASLDNFEKHSGKKSLKMEMLGVRDERNYGVLTGRLPIELVAGKTIEFKGWIKTKDVKNGYASLLFRVDGENKVALGFDNMNNRGLTGTNNWTQVSIKMDVSKDVKDINFGGLFPGEGTAWFDDFELFIDEVKYK